jgi:uncharacterized membrane protein YccC
MAARPDLLVSDAERAQAVNELRRHYDTGRLTLDEFEERLAQAQAARSEAQLREALRQLPPSVNRRDTRWRSLALQYALVNVIAILIWLFSGAEGDFWPKWVLVVTLIMFTRRAFRPRHRALPPPRSR